MQTRKGMSQILTLIVAASVLMMTALTLVFMAQGGLGDAFSGSNRQSCISTVQTQCNTVGSSFGLPESCQTEGIDSSGDFGSSVDRVEGGTVYCAGSSSEGGENNDGENNDGGDLENPFSPPTDE